jgi:hypothetical protein
VWVRQSGAPERPCGQQFVVGHDESGWRVPHVYAADHEPLQLAGAALDAVEPFAHVESGERDVPRPEGRQRSVRVDQLGIETAGARCGDERVIRRAAPVGDDGELHAEIVSLAPSAMGVDPVTRRCRSRYFATGSSRYPTP